jgi:hypothetical protein
MTNMGIYNRTMNFVATNSKTSDKLTSTSISISDSSYSSYRKKEINVLHFCRLFKIGQIPVFDFIIIYLLFYVLNKLYLQCSYKFVLIYAIFTTIFINIVTNRKVRQSKIAIIILIISFFYFLKLSLTNGTSI